MEDRTFLTNNHPTNGISDTFRQFIEALVEEVVINGESFEAQKKWLRKHSESEGISYETIERNLNDLFEAIKELEEHESKSSERLIGFLAKECYLSEALVNKLISNAAEERTQKEADRKAQEEREQKAREEAERKARAERDRIAKEKAQLQKKLDAERKAREEAERKSREEAERKTREDGERKAREEAERKAKEELKNKQTTGVLNGHEYVDLGLPSGTLWATCNVGATKPEDYGDYFAWGEIQPKSNYDRTTHKHYTQTYDKYNGRDGLMFLQLEDDVASCKWGLGWRLPTENELKELLQNTSGIWTSQKGIAGRLFIAPNGNSLFLPAAGYRSDFNLCYSGGLGIYWSCSPEFYHLTAVNLFFNSAYHLLLSDGHRDRGCSVRPVHSS